MLRMINSELGIIVAREGPEIVGYEMPLGLGHARGLPILDPFISRILKLEYKGKALSKYRVVIEGQICVKKGHKGKGVAERLHAAFLERMRGKFDLVVTEISDQNPRSLHVHTMKLGMKVIDTYRAEGRNWQVLLHDLAG
jgi:GNAT superfamily N-acetyltransferase